MGSAASLAKKVHTRSRAYMVERTQVKQIVAQIKKHPRNLQVVSRALVSLDELLHLYDIEDRPVIRMLIYQTHVSPLLVRDKPVCHLLNVMLTQQGVEQIQIASKQLDKLSIARPAAKLFSDLVRDAKLLGEMRAAGCMRLVQDMHSVYHASEPEIKADLRHVFAALRGVYDIQRALKFAKEKEDVELALLVMEYNDTQPQAQIDSLRILSEFARVERMRPKLRAVATTVPRTLASLQQYLRNSDVVLFSCRLLAALARHKGMAMEIAREGGIEVLLSVLHASLKNVLTVEAQQQALWAIDQLVASHRTSACVAATLRRASVTRACALQCRTQRVEIEAGRW